MRRFSTRLIQVLLRDIRPRGQHGLPVNLLSCVHQDRLRLEYLAPQGFHFLLPDTRINAVPVGGRLVGLGARFGDGCP